MKRIKQMPWVLELDGEEVHDCFLFEGDASDCEMAGKGGCGTSKCFLGTGDSREPKFCLRHYFELNGDDREGGYKIVFEH